MKEVELIRCFFAKVRVLGIRHLPHQPLQDVLYLPREVGYCVYYVVYRNRVLYVGRTSFLWGRWNNWYGHHVLDKLKNILPYTELYWREVKPYQSRFVEAIDIRLLKPVNNKRLESLTASLNVRLLLDWIRDLAFYSGSLFLLTLLIFGLS